MKMKKKIDKILEKVKLNKETSKRGWRSFSCDSCGMKWKEPCRDCSSPSEEVCSCGEVLKAIGFQVDENINVDEYGNLI